MLTLLKSVHFRNVGMSVKGICEHHPTGTLPNFGPKTEALVARELNSQHIPRHV